MTGPAKLWYGSVEEGIFGFQGFKVRLLTTFPSYHDEADIHRELMRVVKTPQETYENYVFRVQNIASKGKVSEVAVVKYIISGLSRDRLYDQIAASEYQTVYSLLKRVKWCELNFRMKKPDAGGSLGTRQLPRTAGLAVRAGSSVTTVGSTEFICFNCNEPGHKSVNCPKPQRRPRCSLCLKVGHSSEQCFQRNQSIGTKPVESRMNVAMISANDGEVSDGSVDKEVIDTDEDGMMRCDAIIGRRLKQLNLLVDSGSAVSLIKRSELSNFIRLDSITGTHSVDISGINQSKVMIRGHLNTKVIVASSLVLDASFWVVADETMEAVLYWVEIFSNEITFQSFA